MHKFNGYLNCGLYYPEQKLVVMGIDKNLVEFDLDKMNFTKNVITTKSVFHIEKVNDDTFLTDEESG